MKKYDRSLEEVWEWKAKVYQDVKDCTPAEYLEKLNVDASSLMQAHGVNLSMVRLENMRLVA